MNEEILNWLVKNEKIPQNFLFNEDNSVRDLSQELPTKLKEKLDYYIGNLKGRSVILTGKDCLYKDISAVWLLLNYAHDKKEVQYYNHPNQDISNTAWATAIMRAELSKGSYRANKLAETLTDIVTNGKVFIISCESVNSLDGCFEGSIDKLLINNSIEIVIPEESVKRIKF